MNNIKALTETRAEKMERLQALYAQLEAEQRAVTEEEEKEISAIQEEIEKIDKTIEILEGLKDKLVEANEKKEKTVEKDKEDTSEERAFADYLRGVVTEERADNLTYGDNGAVVPTTIADKIIAKVFEISPILEKSTRYNVVGNIEIPYYPADAKDITVAYATEFVELESTAGKFASVQLGSYLAGALTLVSRSLINNSKFDIVSFVVEHMAYNIARWIEKELLNGTTSKIQGLTGVTETVTAASATAVTVDELIQLQGKVKDVYQPDSIWIMSPATRTAILSLKDNNGRYLLQDDIASPFGKTLLGKPVYVSDNMADMASQATAIYYGDMSGLAVKLSDELEVQVLREKYATQHADGVVAWVDMDAKVENAQKIAKLVMKKATA